jgi:hypothetical protein
MSAVVLSERSSNYSGDPVGKPNLGNMDADMVKLYGNDAALKAGLDAITRSDGNLKDWSIREWMLHPEIFENFGIGGNTVNIYQGGGSTSGGGVGYNVKDEEFGAIGDGLTHPLTAEEAAVYNSLFGSYGAQGAYALIAGDERDFAAIQCALWKAANTGSPVYLPSGTYRVNKSLVLAWSSTPITGQPSSPKCNRIYGDGEFSTIIQGDGIGAGRGILELMGENNGVSVKCNLSNLRLEGLATCSATSWALVVGDAKESFSAEHVYMGSANALLLKSGAITSYANLCSNFKNCAFIPNFALRWFASETTATVYAVNNTTIAGPTGSWVDAVQFVSCNFYGTARISAYSAHFVNCVMSVPANRPANYNICVDMVHGFLQMDAVYMEDYAIGIRVKPIDVTRMVHGVLLNGVRFGGSPIYGALCTHGLYVQGDPAIVIIAGFGVGNITLNGCLSQVTHSVANVFIERAHVNIHGKTDLSYYADWTIALGTGGSYLLNDAGRIKIQSNSVTIAGFEHFGSVNAGMFSNSGNTHGGANATYTNNLISDVGVLSWTVYPSTYASVPLRGGALIQNSYATGRMTFGQGNAVHLWMYAGRLWTGPNGTTGIGPTDGDDGAAHFQINGEAKLKPIADPAGFIEGMVWSGESRGSLRRYQNNQIQTLSFVPDGMVNLVDTSVANTIVEGSVLAAKTFPANWWKVGKTVRITLRGYLGSTATPTLNIRCKFGSVTLVSTGAVAQVGTPTNIGYEVIVDITCRTVGGTGTLMAQGIFRYGANLVHMTSLAAAVVDTTTSQALDITAQWGVANAANFINGTIGLVEAMN